MAPAVAPVLSVLHSFQAALSDIDNISRYSLTKK